MLVKHFIPASMFCCDPCASWEGLMDLQEEQNAASPGRVHLGRVLFAQRIHQPGGLRDCLLQDYALLEDCVQRDRTCDMVYGSVWFQAQMKHLCKDPEGLDQWQRFKGEVCHAHAYGLEVLAFMRRSSGNLVLLSMVMRGLQQQGHIIHEQRQTKSLLEGLARQVQQLSMRQQATNQQLAEDIKALTPSPPPLQAGQDNLCHHASSRSICP